MNWLSMSCEAVSILQDSLQALAKITGSGAVAAIIDKKIEEVKKEEEEGESLG